MSDQCSKLVIEAQKGKQSAYKELLNFYWNDVYTFQLSKINDENLAEDIAIQTFSKAFDKLELYKATYSFKSWLLSISKNLHIDEMRKRKTRTISLEEQREHSHSIQDDSPSPEDQLIIKQNLAELLVYIKLLKPHYQKVIHLRYFQELSYKEIAVHIEEPISNVKVKLLRAKKLLSEIIRSS
jgi:RNA polymerase sigma factor (sigma-70 family)